MAVIAILLVILTTNWLFYRVIIWIPLNLFDLIGKGFWIALGVCFLSFLLWCFKD